MMTPANELARRLIVGLAGPAITAAERAWLTRYQPAGIILFGRNVQNSNQLSDLCQELHTLLRPGAEIVADHEGGPISVLAEAIGRPPSPWTLGVVDDANLTRAVHRATAQMMCEIGIDRLLGPCCDVLSEPRNPVIGARSFGAGVGRVARHVAAAVHGLCDAGLRCCLKHWPGHGGSVVDSHDKAVTSTTGAERKPFARGWQVGAEAVMIGHLPWASSASRTPASSADDERRSPDHDPATLDLRALAAARSAAPSGVLLYTDDVTMGALRSAMARRGIDAGDGRDEGLAAPATLPAAWLDALLRTGHDRLLIRGIPWAACPLPNAPADDTQTRTAETRTAAAAGEPEPYRRARAAVYDHHWRWDRADTLLWLDLTGGDRWGEADRLVPLLQSRFATITRWAVSAGNRRNLEPEKKPPSGRWSNLLVTSHRPLPASLGGTAAVRAACARTGSCLVMGHPSLATDLAVALGTGWRIQATFDVEPADLAPSFAART
jgi:hypothetical protein